MFSRLAIIRIPAAFRLHAHSIQIATAISFIWLFLFFAFRYHDSTGSFSSLKSPSTGPPSTINTNPVTLHSFSPIEVGARYFLDYPLTPPYKEIFGELGQRAVVLRSWIEELQSHVNASADNRQVEGWDAITDLVERVAESLFPYLKPLSTNPRQYSPPLSAIRDRLGIPTNTDTTTTPVSRSVGIVIPTGDKTLRFACHLIASLTRIHKTQLPIQVVYAGPEDLSAEGKNAIQRAADGRDIELLDILTVFDDTTLKLANGGWAIKPFAALASRFEQVILLDADTVFLQDPEELLRQDRYQETGAMLFHDRLLWKGGFPERQDWWHEQIKHPSKETEKSLVWTERYSEEGDSGLVVVDKSRLDVLIGLLHIGWQNSYDVREEWTYKITYGDKETWWIGFEATESTYAFSPHYGGMVGWLRSTEEEKEKAKAKKRREEEELEEEELEEDKIEEGHREQAANKVPRGTGKRESKEEVSVCSFVIAHVDQTDKLLWYNGGLLKNKIVNQTAFEVPTHWMIDQRWIKGGSKKDMSCMVGNNVSTLSEHERDILSRSIAVAQDVDKQLGLL
ncbi:mannosyltransferase putative-domain-containing protein [Mariannaea sp. PMI_226]|nr:mannosyltransferase putative-domain-containing protein [Mariannaea sp. PMI_226]